MFKFLTVTPRKPIMLPDFSQLFGPIDAVIINTLGDDITLTPPTGAAVNARCILSARPGSGSPAVYSWTDNIWAKIDIYSVIVELQENAAPELGKAWTAAYQDKNYAVSEVFKRGDGIIAVVLNQPGNINATVGGWR